MSGPLLPRRGTGLLGGTFDPVHNGHLALAQQALESLRLGRVDFVLAARPWQKRVLTSISDRARMLALALAGREGMRVNLTEVFRDGPTYTVDTLRELRRRCGASEPLVLLIGMDQWANLTTWKNWETLTDYADLAVFNRGEAQSSVPENQKRWSATRIVPREALNRSPCGFISFFDMPPHEASSTAIRRLLSQPRTAENTAKLEKWLPSEVARYIFQQRLYASGR